MGGIPIEDLLKRAEKKVSHQHIATKSTPDLSMVPTFEEEPALDEMSFLMSIEGDFRKEAGNILESLNLSHMIVSAQK
jgi:hypothetical protein